MTTGIEVASLFGVLSLEDRATGTLRGFDTQMQSVEQRISRFGGQMQSVGAGMLALTAPLVGFAAAGIRVASQFDDAMAEISARAGIVGEDLQRISDFALQMGADTAFSANQAADAFLQLLTSGQSTEQAIATLPAVLTAAAASGEDLGRTADLLTDILAAFGLQVEDATMVVDVLAKAAGASSADMASLGQGFNNVGPIARQFGLSVEQTAAILAVFSENGIKGAEAGTQLKSMLTNMTRQTDTVASAWERLGTSMYDAMGNVRPIGDVLQDIRRGLDGMTEQQRIQTIQDLAGSFGQMGLAALTAGDPLSAMLGLMSDSASAADVAAARMNTFSGRMEQLRGSIETLQIRAMKPLMESLKPLIERATEVVNRISDWVAANPDLTATVFQLAGAVAGLGTGLTVVGTVIKLIAPAIGLLTSPFAMAAAGIAATVVGLGVFAQVLGVDVMGGLQVVGQQVNTFLADIGEQGLGGALRNFFTTAENGSSAISRILQGFGMGEEQAEAFGSAINNIAQQVILFVEALPANLSLVGFYFQYYMGMIWSRVQPALQPIIDWFTGDGDDSLNGVISQIPGWVEQNITAPLRGIWIVIEPFVQPIVDFLMTTLGNAIDQVIADIQFMIDMWKSVWGIVQPFLQPLIDFLSDIFNQAADTWEMLRRIGGGSPQRTLPGENSPGVMGNPYQLVPDTTGYGAYTGGGGKAGYQQQQYQNYMSTHVNPIDYRTGQPFPTVTGSYGGMANLPFQMRDSGGRGKAGQPYLIGTGAQPELFVPDSAGSFYPRGGGGMGGGRSVQVGNMNFYITDGDPEKLKQAVFDAIEELGQ